MTSRNWRAKLVRSGCQHIPAICPVLHEQYIPSTLTITTFTTVGSTTWTAPAYVTSVEYLVVGGGGGGGGAYDTGSAGGGGGGLVLTGTLSTTPGNIYSIVVGAGGAGGIGSSPSPPNETAGSNGSDSIFDIITAYGGGGGLRSRDATG